MRIAPVLADLYLAGLLALLPLPAAGGVSRVPTHQGPPSTDTLPPVVVASKPFGESYLLAEMFSQLLESRGYRVDRRPGLGATRIAFQALLSGSIDVYPEYTGTGLLAILGDTNKGDATETFRRVSRRFREEWGLHWLPPLGFQNNYAIAVRRETADSLDLSTLSDLARAAPRLVAGFSPDFMGREDGLPGLKAAYDLDFQATRSLLQAVKYQALEQGRVDVIDAYSTDGLIQRYGLVVLRDDQSFFPPYQAAALVGGRLWSTRPGVVETLTELSGTLDDARMRMLNRRVEVDGVSWAEVAHGALEDLGLLAGAAATPSVHSRDQGGFLGYLWDRRAVTLRLGLRHLLLVGLSLLGAIVVAVPGGLLLERVPRGAEAVIRGVGLLQTLPSIALLAFMIPLLGIGVVPALVALFLYSLFPILRNTYTGVKNADPVAVDAARALGMTPFQVLRHVRLPLAAPIIMAGVRTAAVIDVGTATLAAFIGAGGLGDPIVSGLALSDTRLILSGALPAAILALLVDGILALATEAVEPGGV